MSIIQKSLLRDLLSAVEQNDRHGTEALLQKGLKADEIEEISGKTALFVAAENGHAELLSLLLTSTNNPDSPECLGATPLAYVIHELGDKPSQEKRMHLITTLQLLLDAGANPLGGRDKDQSPLSLCREYKMDDIAILLTSHLGKAG